MRPAPSSMLGCCDTRVMVSTKRHCVPFVPIASPPPSARATESAFACAGSSTSDSTEAGGDEPAPELAPGSARMRAMRKPEALARKGRRPLVAALFGQSVMAWMFFHGAAHAQSSPSSDYVVRASSETAQYADTDHVFVTTPSIAGSVAKPTAGWSVNGSYLVDVVSAASVDIVSTASRRWEEVRQAGTLGGAYAIGALGLAVNGFASSEPDYLSLAGGLVATYDLDQKNVT